MYRFVFKGLIFILIAYITLFFFESFMDKAVSAKSCLKQNWIINIKNQQFEYVFLGSSRTENIIDAKMVEDVTGKKAINVGVTGAGHEEMYLVLYLFLKNGNTIKNLIYQNDIFSFQNRAGVNYHFHDYAFLPYIKDEEVSRVFFDVVGNVKTLLWKYVPYSKYAEFNLWYPIKYLWSENICDGVFYDKYGWAPLSKNSLGELSASKLNLDTVFKKKYFMDSTALEYTSKVFKLAQLHQINVITFSAPEYIKSYETQLNRRELVFKIDSISKNNNAEFYMFDKTKISRKKSLFIDNTHLNSKGARMFTKLLIDSTLKQIK